MYGGNITKRFTISEIANANNYSTEEGEYYQGVIVIESNDSWDVMNEKAVKTIEKLFAKKFPMSEIHLLLPHFKKDYEEYVDKETNKLVRYFKLHYVGRRVR